LSPVAIAAVIFSIIATSHAADIQTLALSGQAAPDAPAGATFASFGTPGDHCRPLVNHLGTASFYGIITGPGITTSNDGGLWIGENGDFRLVAREGDPAPGLPDLTYRGISCLQSFNGYDQISFAGTLAGPGVSTDNDVAFWAGPADYPSLLIRESAQFPGAPGGTRLALRSDVIRRINASGRVMFQTAVSSGINAIFEGMPGSLQLLAKTNDPAPDTTNTFSLVDTPYINDHGAIAFRAGLNPNPTSDGGIWRSMDGQTHLIVRHGTRAPGTPDGVLLASTFLNGITDSGAVIVHAQLSGPGVTTSNDDALYVGEMGSLKLAAREGSQAPGVPVGATFGEVISPASTNGSDIVFRALLSGGGFGGVDMGIWAGPSDDLELRAVTRRSIPGTNLRFRLFSADPTINAQGDVAFFGQLQGSDVSAENDDSLWVVDTSGYLNLIAREGDEFDVGGGELRIISGFADSTLDGPDPAGGRILLNDAGQVVFQLNFTDGSTGIFMATIPEPLSLAVFVVPIAVLSRRLRR
jgi:hypothetical protein